MCLLRLPPDTLLVTWPRCTAARRLIGQRRSTVMQVDAFKGGRSEVVQGYGDRLILVHVDKDVTEIRLYLMITLLRLLGQRLLCDSPDR